VQGQSAEGRRGRSERSQAYGDHATNAVKKERV
jgi:hypothetical protein